MSRQHRKESCGVCIDRGQVIRRKAVERIARRDLEDGVVEAAIQDYDSGPCDGDPNLLATLERADDVDVDWYESELDAARDDWERFVAEQEGN